MTTTRRKTAIAAALLVATALLWVLALLFKLRVTPFFHAVLIKRIGSIPILGFMAAGPVLAAGIGIHLVRRKQARSVGTSLIVLGGYPDLAAGTPPADTDQDGMPDNWETAHGLDPGDSADGNSDRDDDGYTNIEEYLHALLTSPAGGYVPKTRHE